jgi:hypothetical protein
MEWTVAVLASEQLAVFDGILSAEVGKSNHVTGRRAADGRANPATRWRWQSTLVFFSRIGQASEEMPTHPD